MQLDAREVSTRVCQVIFVRVNLLDIASELKSLDRVFARVFRVEQIYSKSLASMNGSLLDTCVSQVKFCVMQV